MYQIKNDQRAIRSSQLLYGGLASLMREKPYDAITVTDLVERAQVGRATFYRQFDTTDDILRMRCDQVFQEMIVYMIEYQRHHHAEAQEIMLKPLLRFFYLHSEIIELLLLANRIDIIQSSLRDQLTPFKPEIATRQGVAEEFTEYGIEIRIGVLTNILVHWVRNDKRHAPDDLADALGTMIEKMVTLDNLV